MVGMNACFCSAVFRRVRRSCEGVLMAGLMLMSLAAPIPGRAQEAVDAETDVAQQNLKLIVGEWADLQRSFKESDSLESPISRFASRLERSGEAVTGLPDSNPKKAGMMAVLQKIATDFPVQANEARGALEARHLTEYWERDSQEAQGWEKESPVAFAGMLKMQSGANSRLGMPKTVVFQTEATRFLERTKPETDSAAVKALLAGIAQSRDAARAKLTSAAEAILAEAAKQKLTPDSRDRLAQFGEDDLRLALEGAPNLAALQAKAAGQVAAFDKAAGGTAAEVSQLSSDLNLHAAAGWPKLAGTVKTTADFDAGAALKDPSKFEGQPILLTGVSNRMGWDFKTGAYDFAMHRNGTAVVGIFDPAVKAVVEEIKARLQLTDLPEEDYDLIAEVTGTAKATVFQDVEGDIKVQGSSDTLKVSGRREVTEEAVLLHIIGLRVGPVAVVAGAGKVQADGSIAPVAGPSGKGGKGGGFLTRFYWAVLALAAGLLTLIRARFPALAGIAPLQKAGQILGSGGMTALGLLFVAVGLLLLIKGFVINGLLLSLAFIATGLYLALDFFTARNWLPVSLSSQLAPRGIVIGLAAAAVAVLHLLLGGRMTMI